MHRNSYPTTRVGVRNEPKKNEDPYSTDVHGPEGDAFFIQCKSVGGRWGTKTGRARFELHLIR